MEKFERVTVSDEAELDKLLRAQWEKTSVIDSKITCLSSMALTTFLRDDDDDDDDDKPKPSAKDWFSAVTRIASSSEKIPFEIWAECGFAAGEFARRAGFIDDCENALPFLSNVKMDRKDFH